MAAEREQNIFALIACAGSGLRAGLPYNKLLYKVGGKTIFEYTLDNFLEARRQKIITHIIILHSPSDKAAFSETAARHQTDIAIGGSTRAASVKNGLDYIMEKYAPLPCDIVLICDGARPNCSVDIIKRCAESVRLYGSGVAAVPVADTVKTAESGIISGTLHRDKLYAAQTPQGFFWGALYKAYAAAGTDAEKLTDDSAVMERFGETGSVRLVTGAYNNYKITTAEDIARFESEKTAGAGRSMNMDFRIGIGSDTHRLAENRKLVLGGVIIPHSLGLDGHSDADALIHSVIDALFSAANLRDIGFHFPDTGAAYKDIDSMTLLKKAAELLKGKQAAVVNISAVIHAQRPKMSPYIPEMAENIANALSINAEQVSISAKTGEGVGIIGGEKAIVCQTVCLVNIHS